MQTSESPRPLATVRVEAVHRPCTYRGIRRSFLVKERPFDVGVDPYNKMTDRVSRDNRKEVSID